jgi:hypothetical protein
MDVHLLSMLPTRLATMCRLGYLPFVLLVTHGLVQVGFDTVEVSP